MKNSSCRTKKRLDWRMADQSQLEMRVKQQKGIVFCTETQDVISKGIGSMPETVHPTLAMKAGLLPDTGVRPFGIIHSCPGMDWRHVGIPKAEYLPWMCQVPAAGGQLWHSLTGYPDTIYDVEILSSVKQGFRGQCAIVLLRREQRCWQR